MITSLNQKGYNQNSKSAQMKCTSQRGQNNCLIDNVCGLQHFTVGQEAAEVT